MKKTELALLLMLVALGLAGCGGKSGLVGRWKAKEAVPPATTDLGKKMEAEVLLKTQIEFRGDGTMTMGAGTMNMDGKYKTDGNLITVEMENPFGSSPSTIDFELSADGRALTRKMRGSNDKLIFERE